MTPATSAVDERFRQYRKSRDRKLRNRLVEDHAVLAERVARRFAASGPESEDVRQVAMVGLLKAVERFDPDRQVKFATFAEPTISGEIRRHFRDRTWAVRVGRRNQDLSLRIRTTTEELSQQLGRTPRPSEIAEALGEDVTAVLTALDARAAYRPDSIDASSGDEPELAARLGSLDERLERSVDVVVLRAVLGELAPREREIVRLRFEEDLSQSEIAQRVGISQMHVSRLLRRTLALLRSRLAGT